MVSVSALSSQTLVDTSGWPHVDIYQFICPAFLVMKHFISNLSVSNPELLILVLNSQAHLMVHVLFFFFF
jgi:hypothetical protein